MYQHGRGVEQSDSEAVRWYRKGAEAGDARGMTNLGWMYQWNWPHEMGSVQLLVMPIQPYALN
jgi:TPR repeat protein